MIPTRLLKMTIFSLGLQYLLTIISTNHIILQIECDDKGKKVVRYALAKVT